VNTCLMTKGKFFSDLPGLSKFFQGFSLSDIDSSIFHKYSYAAGEEILRYHDHSNSVFFILSGEIRIHYYALSGDEVILCDLPAGEMFGELTAIDGQVRSATAVAKTDVLLASMPGRAFVQLIHDNPAFCAAILKRLTDQVRRLTERVFDFSTLAVRNRIHAELLRLAKQNMVSPNSAEINPVPTHAELACFVSTHREAVTRELSELTKHHIIQRRGHVLRIPDVEKLTKMVNDVRGVTDTL
jgi:CRP/FNR family transcriptional regulator, cyclic AMP receptor protein